MLYIETEVQFLAIVFFLMYQLSSFGMASIDICTQANEYKSDCSSVAEYVFSKHETWVQFPAFAFFLVAKKSWSRKKSQVLILSMGNSDSNLQRSVFFTFSSCVGCAPIYTFTYEPTQKRSRNIVNIVQNVNMPAIGVLGGTKTIVFQVFYNPKISDSGYVEFVKRNGTGAIVGTEIKKFW